MGTYFGFLLLVFLAAMTAGGIVALSQWIGPKRSGGVHDLPFESGRIPAQIMRGRFSVKFFVVALLFILFDVELIFLFPWAVTYTELGLFGFFAMLVFLSVVAAGLFYSVKKGVLEWK
jgi:NADH-quinone oxidoreductase subunit A